MEIPWTKAISMNLRGSVGGGSYPFQELTGELPIREPSPHGEEVLFQENDVVVANYAKAGRPTRTCFEEKRFEIVKEQLCPGDVLLINFGHDDANFSKGDLGNMIYIEKGLEPRSFSE